MPPVRRVRRLLNAALCTHPDTSIRSSWPSALSSVGVGNKTTVTGRPTQKQVLTWREFYLLVRNTLRVPGPVGDAAVPEDGDGGDVIENSCVSDAALRAMWKTLVEEDGSTVAATDLLDCLQEPSVMGPRVRGSSNAYLAKDGSMKELPPPEHPAAGAGKFAVSVWVLVLGPKNFM